MRRSQETHKLKTMPTNVRHHREHPPPPPPKSLQIKQEDKFFSKLLSRESSRVNSSSRVFYYGGAPRAVPFQWESQPGTPIHDLAKSSDATAASSLPPLTPPPSYYSKLKSRRFTQSKNADGRSKPKKVSTISNIFSKINHNAKKPRQVSQSPSVSSTSSSSTWSTTSFSSPSVASASSSTESKFNGRDLSGARSFPVHFGLEDAKDDDNNEGGEEEEEEEEEDDEDMFELPISKLRLGARRTFLLKFRSCCPVTKIKSTFVSIAGHGSGQGSV